MLLIKLEKKGPVKLPRREINRQARETYRSMGERWHEKFLREHFLNSATRRYGYTLREGERGGGKDFLRSYSGRKLRKYGHTRPLVKSGLSEKLAKIRDVRATSKGARVVIHARQLNRRNPHSDVNMREEVTAVIPSEERDLAAHGDRDLQRRLRAIRTQESKTL